MHNVATATVRLPCDDRAIFKLSSCGFSAAAVRQPHDSRTIIARVHGLRTIIFFPNMRLKSYGIREITVQSPCGARAAPVR